MWNVWNAKNVRNVDQTVGSMSVCMEKYAYFKYIILQHSAVFLLS